MILLPPGYGGPRVAERTIDAAVPRRAVVIGSFDWPPKRISLERFLAEAAPSWRPPASSCRSSARPPEHPCRSCARAFPSVGFAGRVQDVRPYMAHARIALVPDELGGFKLKGLDYVFNRLPILAMRVALPGMPLRGRAERRPVRQPPRAGRGRGGADRRLRELNRRQREAYEACAARFDWQRIGRHLVDPRAAARLAPLGGEAR